MQVLFLGSGDLRNALYMATQCSEAYHELEIHMSDGCEIVTARNFLISHVMLADSFDPSSPADLQYLWDLWYGCLWNDITSECFIQDVKQLMDNQFINPSIISHGANFNGQLRKILKSWFNTASCKMTLAEINNILKQRFDYYI